MKKNVPRSSINEARATDYPIYYNRKVIGGTGPKRSNPKVDSFSWRGNKISFSSVISNNSIYDFRQCRLGPEPRHPFQFIETRHAPEHVLEAGLISLVVGNKRDWRRAARLILDPVSQILDS